MAISSSDLILKFANEQLNARHSVNRQSLHENEVSFGKMEEILLKFGLLQLLCLAIINCRVIEQYALCTIRCFLFLVFFRIFF